MHVIRLLHHNAIISINVNYRNVIYSYYNLSVKLFILSLKYAQRVIYLYSCMLPTKQIAFTINKNVTIVIFSLRGIHIKRFIAKIQIAT